MEYTPDYSHINQIFVDGLNAFLDYTDPYPLRNTTKEGLVVRRRSSRKEFEKRSIQRWAISELAKAIANDPYSSVEDTTYQFALKMYRFACDSTNMNVMNIFGTAADFINNNVIALFRERDGIYP